MGPGLGSGSGLGLPRAHRLHRCDAVDDDVHGAAERAEHLAHGDPVHEDIVSGEDVAVAAS